MKVDIFIRTHIKNDEGDEEEEFFTIGDYEESDDGYVIRYDENSDFGYENCSVLISVQPNMVIIERSGEASTALYIERGHRHECVYETPYGNMTLGVSAFEINNQLEEDGGTLLVRYGLDLNSDSISENILDIAVSITDTEE